MQFEYCQICAWSVDVGTRLCEVCQALLANPLQTLLAEQRVIVGQLHRALGDEALQARYEAAKTARRATLNAAWWNMFVVLNQRKGTGRKTRT